MRIIIEREGAMSATGMLLADPNIIKTRVYRELSNIYRGSVRSFVEKIILRGMQGTDTGMSKASLIPLGRAVRGLVGNIRSNITATKNVHRRQPLYQSNSFPGMSKYKSIKHGIALGEDAYLLSFGDIRNPVFLFKFEIRVLQYYLKENGLDGSSAWNSLEIGRAAFLRHLEEHIKKMIARTDTERLFRFAEVG